jgi:hypothetical protein
MVKCLFVEVLEAGSTKLEVYNINSLKKSY